jgi:RIP homotypic interaction motif
MALVDATGLARGRYDIDIRGAQGVQIGDHSTQTNTFGAPPR